MAQLDENDAILSDDIPSDLEKTMAAAFDKATAEEPIDAPVETEAEKRARDEQGRFAAEENAVEKPQEAAPVESPVSTVPPPASWPKESQAAFAQLPAALQQQVAQREADRERFVNQKAMEAAESKRTVAAVEQVINPYLPMIQAEGGTALGVVQSMLDTARQLRQDPAGAIMRLAQQYGVNLGNGQPQQSAPEFSALQQRLNFMESQLSQRAMMERQQQETEIADHIGSFAQEVDGSGNPARPHFEAVREDMAALLAANRAQDLQTAYDMAVWARPDIRSSLIASQQAADEAKRAEQSKAAANAARRTAGTQVRGRDGLPAADSPVKMQDTMSAIYDRLMSP